MIGLMAADLNSTLDFKPDAFIEDDCYEYNCYVSLNYKITNITERGRVSVTEHKKY